MISSILTITLSYSFQVRDAISTILLLSHCVHEHVSERVGKQRKRIFQLSSKTNPSLS